jgi:hypothetical protein
MLEADTLPFEIEGVTVRDSKFNCGELSLAARLAGLFMRRGKNHDTLSIKGCVWRSAGTETNSFNDVYDTWTWLESFTGYMHHG